MEFFTLDNSLRRIAIFDQYESLIWTERFRLAGDFQMEIASDRNSRTAMSAGTFCTVNDTKRICQIETVEDTVNSDGAKVLKISGRGIEAPLLGDRIATPGMTSLTATPNWTITGLPAEIARKVFNDICIAKINSYQDGIPFYAAGNLFTPGTIAEPITSITIELDIDTVYNVLVKLCDLYKTMGFRLARNDDASQLYFDVYTGDDRTTLQTARAAVVFSPELDNLSGTSALTSVALQKTVAYVMATNGAAFVYGEGWDVTTAVGFNRRVMYVKSDSDLVAGAPLQAVLQQLGKEQLVMNQAVIAFDGEIPQSGSYSYGPSKDYDLGDLIEVRNSDGLATNMRVDEQIRTSDASGEKSYPTLVSELLITPGSWLAWDAGQYWDDALGYWADV